MGDSGQGTIHSAGGGGVVGQHAAPAPFKLLVGPATGSESNLARMPLIPIVCWRVEDIRFAFDSSFITVNPAPSTDPTSDPDAKPFSDQDDIRTELKLIASLVKDNPGCPLSVFGHADPVGPAVDPDGYNKALSGRRATTVYGLLIANQELSKSVSLWQKVASTENWGSQQQQVMQQATNSPAGTGMSDLITAYLKAICPPELSLGSKDFLAQGADSAGKGDYQGCSSFNPLLIFSQSEETDFEQSGDTVDRNIANAPNRRVMVLMFTKGSKVDPEKWPCPSATGDKSGCLKRFWSDGQARRSTRLPDDDRTYNKTHDTFGCRFYDRLMTTSPCEKSFWVVRLVYAGFTPLSDRTPLANLPYVVTGVDGGSKQINGTTDQDGVLRIPVEADPVTMTLKIAGLEITLDGGSLNKIKITEGVEQRLSNLGYFNPDSQDQSQKSTGSPPSSSDNQTLADAVTLFQQNNNLPLTDGKVDTQTRNSIRQFYGS